MTEAERRLIDAALFFYGTRQDGDMVATQALLNACEAVEDERVDTGADREGKKE